MGKGTGKGGKSPGQKGGKGSFQGNCHYCGVFGHRINECRKKDADMKGKGKGQGQAQSPGWGNPNNPKGKGKGQTSFQKGAWTPIKGGWGKGGKGAYGLEDDWSEGYSGYAFPQGYIVEDTALFQFAREAQNEWHFLNPKKTCKQICPMHKADGGCDSNLVTGGGYGASAGSQDQYDQDLPIAPDDDSGRGRRPPESIH